MSLPRRLSFWGENVKLAETITNMAPNSPRGKLIVFEGIDGSGKSTQVRRLAEHLMRTGHRVHQTFEPTRYRLGSVLRRILTGQEDADEYTIAALFAADRLDHIQHPEYGMETLLQQGQIVLCDRYVFSSYAYNSQKAPLKWVYALNSEASQMLRADLTVFLDISPEAAMERIRQNRDQVDLYESVENLQRVYDRYQLAFAEQGSQDTIRFIDASQSPDKVHAQILGEVDQLFT